MKDVRRARSVPSLSIAVVALVALPLIAGDGKGEAPDPGHADCPMRNAGGAQPSPYVGLEGRSIKALSDEDRERLLAGHGMGLALAAELNSYPGPKHVLELADGLKLTADQRAATQEIFHAMRERAQALGGEIIEAEAALDRQFAQATIDRTHLADAVREIGRLQGELRLAHLLAHLDMRAALTPEQNRRYDELRGYRTADASN